MKPSKERILQLVITAVITVIVGTVGFAMFDIGTAVYAGIAAGLSVSVGKEYGDSLTAVNQWEWGDILAGVIGIIAGILICITVYFSR